MVNKRLINTGKAAPAPFDPLQNFETVTYTGNGSTQKITGYIRKGAAFNGSSSKIQLPSNFNLANNSFSFSFWLANTQASNSYPSYFICSDTSSTTNNQNLGIGREDTTGKLSFNFFANGLLSSTNVSTDGTWQHWVCTYDASTNSRRIYLNGSLDNSDTSASDFLGTSNLNLGNYRQILWALGSIDQVRIFNRALDETTDGEVTTLYNETYDSSTKSTTDIFGDGSGVALYELDEDANDTGVPIDSGQSAVFNGSNSKINTGVTNAFDLQTFSVSAWINLNNSSPQTFVCNFGTDSQPNGLGWAFQINGSGQLYFGDAYGTSVAGSVLATNTWIHVVSVCNVSTGEQTIYLNGQQDATRNNYSGIAYVAGGFPAGSRRLTIGELGGNNVSWLNGKIDQVRIYSSALSASDVEALASETNVPTANLVAYYKLDGDATDETGSYDGTATSITYSDPAIRNYSGTPTNINFLGMAFQPDLVWVKNRSVAVNHYLYDSIRGTGAAKALHSNTTNSEASASTYSVNGGVQSIDSNGFTVFKGTDNTYQGTNLNGNNYVAWCWKAGGAAVSNTDGTITSTVSANPDAGFSIVKYTGENSARTVGHGLSSAPEMVIIKNLDDARNWMVWHKDLSASSYLHLNLNDSEATDTRTNGGQPRPFGPFTSTTFGVNIDNETGYTDDYIAYCFHSVDGYQKLGSYLGTNAPNNVVTTGFRPRWIMIKSTGATNGDWNIFDTVRENEPLGDALKANTSSSEGTEAAFVVDITDTGFELDGASGAGGTGQINSSGITYIYLAIA